jgi:hypothetical protein
VVHVCTGPLDIARVCVSVCELSRPADISGGTKARGTALVYEIVAQFWLPWKPEGGYCGRYQLLLNTIQWLETLLIYSLNNIC